MLRCNILLENFNFHKTTMHQVTKRLFTAEAQLKRTKLCDFHKAHGGKLVDFAGFYMPVQYSNMSIQESTLHTRKNASIFDVSHMGQLRYFYPFLCKDILDILHHIFHCNLLSINIDTDFMVMIV